MSRRSELMIVFVLVIDVACGTSRAAAQSYTYPRVAAIDQHQMGENVEIQLPRSAAPDSISRDALFFTPVKDSKDWDAGAAGSPVVSNPCRFFAPKEQSQMKGLPPIFLFAVVAANWSDGMFGDAFLRTVPGAQREQFVADVEREARRTLFRDSQWVMDYRRLRIAASRTSGSKSHQAHL